MSVEDKALKAYWQKQRKEWDLIKEQLKRDHIRIRKDVETRKLRVLSGVILPGEEIRDGKYYCKGDYDESHFFLWWN